MGRVRTGDLRRPVLNQSWVGLRISLRSVGVRWEVAAMSKNQHRVSTLVTLGVNNVMRYYISE